VIIAGIRTYSPASNPVRAKFVPFTDILKVAIDFLFPYFYYGNFPTLPTPFTSPSLPAFDTYLFLSSFMVFDLVPFLGIFLQGCLQVSNI